MLCTDSTNVPIAFNLIRKYGLNTEGGLLNSYGIAFDGCQFLRIEKVESLECEASQVELPWLHVTIQFFSKAKSKLGVGFSR